MGRRDLVRDRGDIDVRKWLVAQLGIGSFAGTFVVADVLCDEAEDEIMVKRWESWDKEDQNYIRVNWNKLTTAELATDLDRTPEAVKMQAAKMGLYRRRCNTMVDKERDAEYMKRLQKHEQR